MSEMLTIGIDPGHGMSNREHGVYDPGASAGPGINEARITLIIAGYLRDACLQRGWKTAMTRTSTADDAPLRDRVMRMRMAGADCIVSLHLNAHEREHANGTETLYLASEWVAAEVQRQVVAALGTTDRGCKQRDDLAILRYERPAILVEFGFLTNGHDRDKLVDRGMQRAAAHAIADGISRTVRL